MHLFVCKGSANRTKNQIYLSFSEVQVTSPRVKVTNKRAQYKTKSLKSCISYTNACSHRVIPAPKRCCSQHFLHQETFCESLTIVPGIIRIFGTTCPDASDNQYEYLVRTVHGTRTGCTGYSDGWWICRIFERLMGPRHPA